MNRAENSAGTANSRRVGRPFQRGVSGNPGGRPKGLVRSIREQTKDGVQLVEFMLQVFRGEVEGAKLGTGSTRRRGSQTGVFGKPVQALEHAGREGEPLIPVELIQAVVAEAGDERQTVD